MLTSNTELVGENVASALTMVAGEKRFICKQNHSCCTSAAEFVQPLLPPPVWGGNSAQSQMGWCGRKPVCACLQWESWKDWNSSFLIGDTKPVGFSCGIPSTCEMVLAGGFSSTAGPMQSQRWRWTPETPWGNCRKVPFSQRKDKPGP